MESFSEQNLMEDSNFNAIFANFFRGFFFLDFKYFNGMNFVYPKVSLIIKKRWGCPFLFFSLSS